MRTEGSVDIGMSPRVAGRPVSLSTRLRMVFNSLAVAALWIVAGWWVVAVHPLMGPVVLTFTETNGVHLGDLPALALAVFGTVGLRGRRARRLE
jgi:hypothetical protein